MALSAHVGFIVPQEYKMYHVGPGNNTNISCNKTMKEYNKPRQL